MTGVRIDHNEPPPPTTDLATAAGFALLLDFFTPMTAPTGATVAEPKVYGRTGPGGRDLPLPVPRRLDARYRRPRNVSNPRGGWSACGQGPRSRRTAQ